MKRLLTFCENQIGLAKLDSTWYRKVLRPYLPSYSIEDQPQMPLTITIKSEKKTLLVAETSGNEIHK